MSSATLESSEHTIPPWFSELLGIPTILDNEEFMLRDVKLKLDAGVLRADTLFSQEQEQTKDVFGFKWQKRDMFESEASQKQRTEWSNEKYRPATHWLPKNATPWLILDAGCGAAHTALSYFGQIKSNIHYIGADISNAVDIAKLRMEQQKFKAAFFQCDLMDLPIPIGTLDVIFSEGVLHHTDSTEDALKSLATLLKRDGLFMFYVYREKGPIREFSDDFIRQKLQDFNQDDAWNALLPITKLGKVLGELNLEIDVPERIDLLDIDAGKINIQRLFYWHVMKCFYRSDFTIDEMNHINFDWFAPKNAFRQTPEDVRQWCKQANLEIEHEQIEEAGITIVARKS